MTQRDKMHRCKICKRLWLDEECLLDENEGLQCPNKCVPIFQQDEYELPTND